MPRKRKKRVIAIIRWSVATGKAVWVSHKRTYFAEYWAYSRACKKELERHRNWPKVVAERRKNILQLISGLLEHSGITDSGTLPPEKRTALNELRKMADTEPVCCTSFYDHIMEERRQKRNAKRREKRWKEKYGNKSE